MAYEQRMTKYLAEFILYSFKIGLYDTFTRLSTINAQQMVDNFVDSTYLSTFVHIVKPAYSDKNRLS